MPSSSCTPAPGAEQTGSPNDIWSHKWILSGRCVCRRRDQDLRLSHGSRRLQDRRVRHELGHLLFGLPDLYDTDDSSEGIGNWCLMASGSWGGGGDVPAHPSAWCKANQGWVTVVNQATNGP